MIYLLYLFLLVGLLITAVALFMQSPQFGKRPDNRTERIRLSPNYRNGAFQNISHTPALAEGATPWKIIKEYIFPKSKNKNPDRALPSVKTNLKNNSPTESFIVWFGHSSYFLQINNFKMLVDPVFSGNASPVSFFAKSYKGTDVYSTDDFPDLDLLLITHDHFDHLDYNTVKKLIPKIKRVVTSLGVGTHLKRWGYDPSKIIELDWYEKAELTSSFSLLAAPARHFSGRTFKRNQTLWSSFVLKVPEHTIYLGGDSGYDFHFKEIGNKYGPFDLAILECGQYNEFWKYIHMMPEETVQAAIDLKASALMPVHWAKFTLSLHDWNESINRATAESKKKNLPLVVPRIGEKVILGSAGTQNDWW
jgi:L-ascorbate metabolism protein UlaG (beta-lactamase superfamily)